VGKSRAARRVRALRAPEASAPCAANADGIAQCLRMLAEEAASVGFASTVAALWMAIRVCEQELVQGRARWDAQKDIPAPRHFTPVNPILPAIPSVN
jgi:hypothetical protein